MRRRAVLLGALLAAGRGSSATAAANARVPAQFTILRGGAVTPPTITVPAHFRWSSYL